MSLCSGVHVLICSTVSLNRKPKIACSFPPKTLSSSKAQRRRATEAMRGISVVTIDPKPKKNLISSFIDFLEHMIVRLMHDSSKAMPFLSGNYQPITEETPPFSDLPLTGVLPECLNGEFFRAGPNPKFAPVGGYHWFDGDGMIHGLRIKDGKATYVSRFVRTSRLKQEEFFRGSKFIKFGDLKGVYGLLISYIYTLREKMKVLDVSFGSGTANTSVVYHHGNLLALHEGDKPYVMKVMEDGDLQTIGMLDYDKRLQHPFTAHPKIDPVTGELFGFGYQFVEPYVTYRVVSREGVMSEPVPIMIPDPIMMHDFAITENYALFMDLPLVLNPKEMVTKKKLTLSFDKKRKSRFGVLPRYAKDDALIKWFDLPNCFIFHVANAWEEGDEVVLISCRFQDMDLNMFATPSKPTEESFTNELYEMRFNMTTGLATQRKLSGRAVEFPRINDNFVGRKQRYVYGTVVDGSGRISRIAKFDLQEEPKIGMDKIEIGGNVKGIFNLGPNRFGSEAVFISRESETPAEEDDGYLIFFLFDENVSKSYVYVIDAKTMSDDPIAVVELPQRVPFGFHACFVPEEMLLEQANINV